MLYLAIGERAPAERIGDAEIRFVPFEKDRARLAQYYRASDVYVHAAKAENFPNAVLEALACGVPCMATSVGGIPEMIVPDHNGLLVPPSQPQALADGIEQLLLNPAELSRLGANGSADARAKFSLPHQARAYVAFYHKVLEDFEHWRCTGMRPETASPGLIPAMSEMKSD